jgi:hypothetical protein
MRETTGSSLITLFIIFLLQDIKAPSISGDPNNMTLLAEEARNLADK